MPTLPEFPKRLVRLSARALGRLIGARRRAPRRPVRASLTFFGGASRGTCPACGEDIGEGEPATSLHGDSYHAACAFYRRRAA